MIAEQEVTVEQALSWLQSEMDARGIAGQILRDQLRVREGVAATFIGVPVRIDDETLDAYDEAKLLVELESAWNFREPQPEMLLLLVPAGIPDGAW
jgi:hypothetical protein